MQPLKDVMLTILRNKTALLTQVPLFWKWQCPSESFIDKNLGITMCNRYGWGYAPAYALTFIMPMHADLTFNVWRSDTWISFARPWNCFVHPKFWRSRAPQPMINESVGINTPASLPSGERCVPIWVPSLPTVMSSGQGLDKTNSTSCLLSPVSLYHSTLSLQRFPSK